MLEASYKEFIEDILTVVVVKAINLRTGEDLSCV